MKNISNIIYFNFFKCLLNLNVLIFLKKGILCSKFWINLNGYSYL